MKATFQACASRMKFMMGISRVITQQRRIARGTPYGAFIYQPNDIYQHEILHTGCCKKFVWEVIAQDTVEKIIKFR